MPTPSWSCILIHIHELDSGAPWKYPAWQDRTGIRHGLFPPDDAHLPPKMSRAQCSLIASWFSAYLNVAKDKRYAFASARDGEDCYVGRKLWNTWVQEHMGRWNVSLTVDRVLKDAHVHPALLMQAFKTDNVEAGQAHVALPLICSALFGAEQCIVISGDLRINKEWSAISSHILNKSWQRLTHQLKRMRINVENLGESAERLVEEFMNQPRCTKAGFNKLLRKLSEFHTAALAFTGNDGIVQRVQTCLGRVESLFEEYGKKVPVRGKGKGTKKLNRNQVLQLATEEEIDEMWNTYRRLFLPDIIPEDDGCTPAERMQESVELGELGTTDNAFGSDDMGVTEEKELSLHQLHAGLGIVSGHFPGFNKFISKSGVNPWDHPDAYDTAIVDEDGDWDLLHLRWHQLVGLYALVRELMYESIPEAVQGVMLADKVGVGKTTVCMSFIALVNHLAALDEAKKPWPPALAKKIYLGTFKGIPDRPHIICVPGTLIAQWKDELTTWFLRHNIAVLVYTGGDATRTEFWGPDGPWQRRNVLDRQTIILVSHTALGADASIKFMIHSRQDDWAMTPAEKSTSIPTIFDLLPMTLILDEGHMLRNRGKQYYGMLALRDRALAIIVATATPLHTAPKDLASEGRMLNIRQFISPDCQEEEIDDIKHLRKIRAKRTQEDKAADLQRSAAALRGEDRPETATAIELRAAGVLIARRLRKYFGSRIIRRSVDSKDFDGKPIHDILPSITIDLYCQPSEFELEIIGAARDKAATSITDALAGAFDGSSFYIEFRKGLGFHAAATRGATLPDIKTIDDWTPVKSTKYQVTVDTVLHLLQRDDAPKPVSNKDGAIEFPALPDLPEGAPVPGQMRKGVIYAEFTSMVPLLQQVFRVHGVETLAFNGNMSLSQRQQCIREFRKNPKNRILIISAVGNTGLNLACADFVIFVDQPWSGQDIDQTEGRVHRYPQKREVWIIHILALGTTDVIMSSMARGKKDMLDAFVRLKGGQEALDALQGYIGEEAEEITPEPSKKPGKANSQRAAKQAKQAKAKPKCKKQEKWPVSTSKAIGTSLVGPKPMQEIESGVSTQNHVGEGFDNDVSQQQSLVSSQSEMALPSRPQAPTHSDDYGGDLNGFDNFDLDPPITLSPPVAAKRKSSLSAGDSRSAKKPCISYAPDSATIPVNKYVALKTPASVSGGPVSQLTVLKGGKEMYKPNLGHRTDEYGHENNSDESRVYRPLPKRTSRGSDLSILNGFLGNLHQSKPGPVSRRLDKHGDNSVSAMAGKGKQKD